ncbi:MAG TPA: 3-oxo-tetronate kinase [Casimicrobiaceae bacterium]|nr:3-oxo-tetronate kinase [Casimicrobiaceae bacterium]
MNPIALGVIADDFTGATDVASMLVAAGLRTVQTIGVPRDRAIVAEADAVVVALKSRTIAPRDAITQSLAALEWLRSCGAQQYYFKYCSTFDSTDEGNIGPVADALLDALGAPFTIACPAFPANRRTIYLGNLFVGDVPLAESPMRDHPLTPMRDSSLVRVLQRQTKRRVGLVPWPVVQHGANAIRGEFAKLVSDGVAYAIVDAIDDDDLLDIGAACNELPLVTAGSGLALGLPQNYRGLVTLRDDAARMPDVRGKSAILAGSCSAATRAQVAAFVASSHTAVALNPFVGSADRIADEAMRSVDGELIAARPFVIYSTAEPQAVADVQRRLGRERAASLIEEAFGVLATELVRRGVRRLVVAGGETSGAVVQALGVQALAIGPSIAPGVPWTLSLGEPALALALKSGNFGGDDFFARALAMLPR